MHLHPALVSKAVEEVKKRSEVVVILTPPGSSRIEVAKAVAGSC